MNTHQHPMKIAIIGGGIGGLALANCFQNKNIAFTIYEKSPKFGEVGAGIGLSESTFKILNEIGLGEDIKQHAQFVKNVIIVNKKHQHIRKLPIVNGGFCIHRAMLIEILSKKINLQNVHFNAEIVDFKNRENETELTLKNGDTATYDYVFACDGIHSVFRKKIFPQIEKRYSGQTVWRGISKSSLPPTFHDALLEFWGDNVRFVIIPIQENTYYWCACRWAKEGETDKAEELKGHLKSLFKHFIPEVNQVIEETPSIIRNDMCDLKPHPMPWHFDRIVFLGDAIHATTPNLAQGGCQAIEDAHTLSILISENGCKPNVFKEYQKRRVKKVHYIVKQSWNYGKISQQKFIVAEWLRNAIFKFLPNKIFLDQYNQLIDLDYLKNPKI